MRIPLSWLKEFVAIHDSPDALAHRLTMSGFEVEAIEQIGDDTVFEVNVTPNRPDCLSIIGIAREVAALYGLPLRFPELTILSEPKPLDFNVDILDTDLCNRYAGRIVRNVKIGPSPEWMKTRLEKCGIRSINSVVDITNYVLLEFGHPLHAFDLNLLRGNRIRVGTPKSVVGSVDPVSFTTLDGTEHAVVPDMLLIWDADVPVAIAGIMGGLDSEVKETTTDVFLESAYFEPTSIRRTSKRLGLKTESSYRFERGTDIKILKKALDRAALLLKELAHGEIHGKLDIYPKTWHPAGIKVRYSRVNHVLGTALTHGRILESLKGLELDIVEEAGDHFVVKTPPYRRDITMEEDVIEEVARMYGFDKIPSELPRSTFGASESVSDASRVLPLKQALRSAFLSSGFTETINYSFVGQADLDRLRLPADDARRVCVSVQNPLREEDAFMRTCMLPSLIRNLVTNVAQGNREFRLFEQARVFLGRPGKALPEEREHLATVVYREKAKGLYRDEVPDFFRVKGLLEALFRDMRILAVTWRRSDEPFLHPGQSADILIDGERVGFVGVLSPLVSATLDIKAQKPSIVVSELDLTTLLPHLGTRAVFHPIARFPSVERDTAMVVDAALDAAAIIGHIHAFKTDVVEEASIFDVYQGAALGEGKKSIAFNVRYRAVDRTMTDKEVDTLHAGLVRYVTDRTGGHVRQ
ncbi:MAG TPA: phenylalanine--tRNA ligase subunit beta [Dissulfurispiraceae bacterium]|nr:phenylalanine--tRNA ligase subunit beta [Dissulfurispiraceae bacterium]